MIDHLNRYIIENYGKKSVFSNFLPGISGEMGIPLWCFYVNRGQAVSSFGIADKDHSIMQFYPAHQSYQNTQRLGFRTFIKTEGKVFEAFLEEENPHRMAISMNGLEIQEESEEAKYGIRVQYHTLPMESVPGLIRTVTIENRDNKEHTYEILDGMAAVLPFGVRLSDMTEMGQTCKAWMQTLNVETGYPFFTLRASMEDSAEVNEIKGGNFGFALDQEGQNLPVIVSSNLIFGYDTAMGKPVHFQEEKLQHILGERQRTENELPCCFFGLTMKLKPGETKTFHELYGQIEEIEALVELKKKAMEPEYFSIKEKEAEELPWKITDKIGTKTGNELFDLYCRQAYLDNILRGGEPTLIGKNKVFYLYSRKHGDMERDYNYFRLLPEYYSQGNGNFRDVNQNRRVDVRFSPYVGTDNIRLFYNAIQIDGYNPLGIEKMTFLLNSEEAGLYGILKEFLEQPFTPGALMHHLVLENKKELFEEIIEMSQAAGKTDFLDGYWSDHWTYNLDLVEEYLAVFPDHKEELLTGNRDYTFTIGKEFILPGRKRYVETKRGIRQYHFLERNDRYQPDTFLRNQKEKIVKINLLEKILLLGILKTAALDPFGMGVEMEGGKPGWYDALNGLPGLLGSSMAETYELRRVLEFIINAGLNQNSIIVLPEELSILMEALADSTEEYLKNNCSEKMSFYRKRQEALEKYRSAVHYATSGMEVTYHYNQIVDKVKILFEGVKAGIEEAMEIAKAEKRGICPTYFTYRVTDFEKTNEGIEIINVIQENVPDFLEGSVRYLKTGISKLEKKNLYNAIRNSNLYDEKLSMYKVNAGLDQAGIEIGRAKAFTPGWLENESIWLHMEYKYLLELLKGDLKEEFLEDFLKVLIPFQKEEIYGRSLLENSSFLASSANPDPTIHGKGFVARLSGSTVEFIHMWQIMMFGKQPFFMEKDNDGQTKLVLRFSPLIPEYLIGEDCKIEAMFLGKIKVIYQMPDRKTVNMEDTEIISYEIDKILVEQNMIIGDLAERIRRGDVGCIKVVIGRKKGNRDL